MEIKDKLELLRLCVEAVKNEREKLKQRTEESEARIKILNRVIKSLNKDNNLITITTKGM